MGLGKAGRELWGKSGPRALPGVYPKGGRMRCVLDKYKWPSLELLASARRAVAGACWPTLLQFTSFEFGSNSICLMVRILLGKPMLVRLCLPAL